MVGMGGVLLQGVRSMTSPAVLPAARRRSRWFADRPIGIKIMAMIAFSASVGVLLCALAVGRIDALDASQQDLYHGHVVALSDLDAIQETYSDIQQGYTGYFLADAAARAALKPRLADARATLDAELEAYANGTEHPQRVAGLRKDI